MDGSRLSKNLATIVGLTAIYFLAGKFGLRLAFVHASASAVWPSTGIALASFLRSSAMACGPAF